MQRSHRKKYQKNDLSASTQTGHGPVTGVSDIFEMIADNLRIVQIMILVNQAVVEGFKAGIAHGFAPDRGKLREFCA